MIKLFLVLKCEKKWKGTKKGYKAASECMKRLIKQKPKISNIFISIEWPFKAEVVETPGFEKWARKEARRIANKFDKEIGMKTAIKFRAEYEKKEKKKVLDTSPSLVLGC